MNRLEDALKKATSYEDRCSKFDQWLQETEAKLTKMEPFSIASQPLKRQLEEAKVKKRNNQALLNVKALYLLCPFLVGI